ncbi:hypothetical protein RJT34_28573 [Clitoria ternatea]|uniref:Uncharacterized protein n=1 Tax=Clitoria ternatea TaxID=43366 RepID=A0AAN9FB68_CLITE
MRALCKPAMYCDMRAGSLHFTEPKPAIGDSHMRLGFCLSSVFNELVTLLVLFGLWPGSLYSWTCETGRSKQNFYVLSYAMRFD